MKIIDYDKSIDKKGIVDEAYVICNSANFPVTYQDVYDYVLKDINNLAIDLRVRNIIYDYIHCLASFNYDKNY